MYIGNKVKKKFLKIISMIVFVNKKFSPKMKSFLTYYQVNFVLTILYYLKYEILSK